MYTTSAALPVTSGALLLGFGPSIGHLWVGVTLILIGVLMFGLFRLVLAEKR